VAEIDENVGQECVINDKTDRRVTYDQVDDGNDDVDPHAPSRPNLLFADVVDLQRATAQ
jgi:hypothetical protein